MTTETTALRQKFEDAKAKIRANSKDSHFADTLINELITAHSQLKRDCIYPNISHRDVEESYDGGNFKIETFKDGSVLYRTTGGFSIIGDYRISGLNTVLRDFIKKLNGETEISDDMRELVELDLSATAYILNIPMFAFSDVDLKFELATKVVEYLNGLYETATAADPSEEDVDANKAYYDAVIGGKNADEIKDLIGKD